MNRAWIPAGALASVSVAGLIALGPLTDSLGTTRVVPDRASPVNTSADHGRKRGGAGERQTSRPSARRRPLRSCAAVSRRRRGRRHPTTSDAARSATGKRVGRAERDGHRSKPKPAVKPAKKRRRSGSSRSATTGEPNGDSGFAGGGQGSQGQGETSSTLAPWTPVRGARTPGSRGHGSAGTIGPSRGYSSVGRAPGSHPGGQRFEPA